MIAHEILNSARDYAGSPESTFPGKFGHVVRYHEADLLAFLQKHTVGQRLYV